MQAIVCREHGGPEVMKYEEIPQPTPAARTVLIKADASGPLRLQIGKVDSLRDAAQAHRDLASCLTTGKLVLKP